MDCERVTRSLAAGDALSAEEAAHVASCRTCAARAALIGALAPPPVAASAPAPDPAALRRRSRARDLRHAGLVAAALAAVAGAAWLARPSPDRTDVDLLAALDDAETAVVADVDVVGDDVLAALIVDDPLDGDPTDLLIEALTDEESP